MQLLIYLKMILMENQVFDEIIECNEVMRDYGLKLNKEDVKEIINPYKRVYIFLKFKN